MSQITIRPFAHNNEDYQGIVSIWNATWPEDKTSVENMEYYDTSRNPKYFWRRLLIEKNNTPVAFAFYSESWWSPRPGKFYVDIVVHPDFQCQGIGTAVYDHIYNILQQKDEFTMLTAETRESKTGAITFLKKRGFAQVMRYPISHLTVDQFDAHPFTDAIKRVNESEIEIKTAAELMAEDPEWLRKMWELECAVQKDIPYPDELVDQPFEDFVKIVDNPGFFPEAFLVAKENGPFCFNKHAVEKQSQSPTNCSQG
jgi:GNAT superfamily N-acetyltransferase